MQKKKLMIITHDLAIGGLQQVIVNLCRSINRDIFEVGVLCLRSRGELASEVEQLGIKVHDLISENVSSDYFQFLRVGRILRKKRVDIVHTHNTQPFIDGTLGALLAGVKTLVHTDHARDFPDRKRYMIAEWALSHFAYKIVGVSDHTKYNLMKYEKIPAQKIVTIVNGVDQTKFALKFDINKKKRYLGLSDSVPILGLGVRLTKQKGITYLLQALPAVIEQYPRVALVVAGQGPLMENLKSEAASLNIAGNVHFLGPRTDMSEIMKVFDLYVLPSLWEGLPMVIIEAMAAGVPIVATDVGGNATAISHRENGSLVPPGDPAVLANEILHVLSDDRIARAYIEKSKAKFNQYFSSAVMARKYEALYLKKVLN